MLSEAAVKPELADKEGQVAPDRRRRTRLVAALTAALLLAGALAYTSFSSAAQVRSPSQLASAVRGRSYQVTGTVLPGYTRDGIQLDFRIEDRSGPASSAIKVRYKGAVPDPFKAGREVIVTVVKSGSSFVGQRDSLITKCPSKFSTAPTTSASSGSSGA
jgi:cytochrome c-type biogenesis protein CcmE